MNTPINLSGWAVIILVMEPVQSLTLYRSMIPSRRFSMLILLSSTPVSEIVTVVWSCADSWMFFHFQMSSRALTIRPSLPPSKNSNYKDGVDDETFFCLSPLASLLGISHIHKSPLPHFFYRPMWWDTWVNISRIMLGCSVINIILAILKPKSRDHNRITARISYL